MTSMREFTHRLNAHKEQQQVEWERARWMAFSIFSPFVKNGPRTPKQWMRFPWDKDSPAMVVVIDETKANTLNNLYLDFMSRKNKIRS